MTGLSLGNDAGVPFEADYVRLFDYAQLNSVFTNYADNYQDARVAEGTLPQDKLSQGLVLVAAFDTSTASATSLVSFSESGEQEEFSCSVDDNMFVTSTVPIVESYETVIEQPIEYAEDVIGECIEAFNDTALKNNCLGEMGDSMEDFLWNRCLESVANDVSASSTADLFAFVCVTVTDVDECTFNGTMGMCEDDTIGEFEAQVRFYFQFELFINNTTICKNYYSVCLAPKLLRY